MSITKIWGKAVQNHLSMTANWEPGTAREVGDYGTIENGVFRHLGNVYEKLSLKPQVRTFPMGEPRRFQSHVVTKPAAKLGAAVGPDGAEWVKASIELEFARDKAILFELIPEKSDRLLNTDAVAYEILRKYESGYWDVEWWVVTETITAASGLLVINQEGKNKVRLEANAPTLKDLKLTDPKIDFALDHEASRTYNVKLSSPATPLLSVARLRRRMFRRPTFRSIDLGDSGYFLSLHDAAAEDMALSQATLGTPDDYQWVLEESLPEIAD